VSSGSIRRSPPSRTARALVEARRPTWVERLGLAASRLIARLRARLGGR